MTNYIRVCLTAEYLFTLRHTGYACDPIVHEALRHHLEAALSGDVTSELYRGGYAKVAQSDNAVEDTKIFGDGRTPGAIPRPSQPGLSKSGPDRRKQMTDFTMTKDADGVATITWDVAGQDR